jgi:RNA polymerase sigma-70 factor (ECF subfamily)
LVRFYERRRPATGELSHETAESAAADAEWTAEFNAQILRAALEASRGEFEPATWRAFELVWLDDRTAAEAARELDVPIGAIYVAKSRVLKRLREEVIHLAEDAVYLLPLG